MQKGRESHHYHYIVYALIPFEKTSLVPCPHLPLHGSFEAFPNERSCTHFSVVGNSAEGQAEPSPRWARAPLWAEGLPLWMEAYGPALGKAQDDTVYGCRFSWSYQGQQQKDWIFKKIRWGNILNWHGKSKPDCYSERSWRLLPQSCITIMNIYFALFL